MGYGGQMVTMDVTRRLAFAYVTNGIKSGLSDSMLNFQRIIDSIYAGID